MRQELYSWVTQSITGAKTNCRYNKDRDGMKPTFDADDAEPAEANDGQAFSASARVYRKSAKREETQRRNRETMEEAAWQMFATKGFDATTARDIIAASGVSPGTFYNYYGTVESIFDVVLSRVVQEVSAVTAAARARGSTLEDMLYLSNRAFLERISSMPLAREFFERNQHHIRINLYAGKTAARLHEDMRADIMGMMPDAHLSPGEEKLVTTLIFSSGLEALFLMASGQASDTGSISRFITQLTLRGLQQWSTLENDR
jgi:AcrR family transcriptional regulator